MRRLPSQLWAGLLLSAILAGQVQAAPQIVWKKGYPKPGPAAGSITVAGTMFMEKGWQPISRVVVIIAWPREGGAPYKGVAQISGTDVALDWTGRIRGLESGETYNVVVDFTFIDGTEVKTYRTGIAEVKAK